MAVKISSRQKYVARIDGPTGDLHNSYLGMWGSSAKDEIPAPKRTKCHPWHSHLAQRENALYVPVTRNCRLGELIPDFILGRSRAKRQEAQ
ncbi:hypothetical protein CEXT_237881 [Caerostris extrusa]|uniref:Uncharacterized protein n=1 Tax=Caerostris extrusa TaxID=172846 RepID=A0AAV4XDL2_CAEEX|nr:hypothetical protein CEXT_237881 [Caerostris extrusa]